ncbi:MAG: carboxymethylenebutenolidase [Alphaproteobacteria bacterium]|nr:carboxymethylenebutenolidase [Alphaproteobacteria bacterium]
MDQRIIDLYDRFTHGFIDRRLFLERAGEIVGSAAAAAALLPLLRCDYAKAETIAANDPRLANEKITYDTPAGKVSGYLSRPAAKGKRPAVVLISQNRGLNPHIQDVARRLGTEGYLTLAPDLLSPFGGTPADDEQAAKLFAEKINREDMTIPIATVSFLKTHAESSGKVGIVGFCVGGGMVDRTAMNSPDLDAAVAYYGPIPADKSKVKDIKAPLLLHYGGLDTNLNAGIPAWEEALKAAGKKYTIYIYEGANHAFTDDTAGPRYNKAAADLAWGRTLAFFKENLGAPPKAG